VDSKLQPTEVFIQVQGEIVVNRAWALISQEPDKPGIAAVEVDLATKYADLMTYSNGIIQCGSEEKLSAPSLVLCANENTLHLHPSAFGPTTIMLSEFKDWDIFCATVSRYSVRICLTSELL
jgi:hypothetical protein